MLNDIDPAFLAFESLMVALLGACLLHASRRGTGYVAELLGGLVFGVLLEWVNITFLPGYTYGRFLLMLDGVPICIGVGWAVIIYTAMAFTDRLGLATWTRPTTDALLALNIDLAMDAIAVRLGSGMWVWGWPNEALRWTGEWFGVPFGNFFGWFWVVTLYSAWVRLFRRLAERRSWGTAARVAGPFLAVVLSEPILYVLLRLFRSLWVAGVPSGLMLLAVVLPALALVLLRGRPQRRAEPRGWVIAGVPVAFHAYFLILLLALNAGLPGWNPWLVPVSIAMLTIGLILHFGPLPGRYS